MVGYCVCGGLSVGYCLRVSEASSIQGEDVLQNRAYVKFYEIL